MLMSLSRRGFLGLAGLVLAGAAADSLPAKELFVPHTRCMLPTQGQAGWEPGIRAANPFMLEQVVRFIGVNDAGNPYAWREVVLPPMGSMFDDFRSLFGLSGPNLEMLRNVVVDVPDPAHYKNDAYCSLTAPATLDCDDANSAVKPGNAETCNGVDDNCVGGVDEGLVFATYYLDGDRDSYGTSSSQQRCSAATTTKYTATRSGDCDDNNFNVKPGADEVCTNTVDDNCNGFVGKTYYQDADKDGYGSRATACKDSADDGWSLVTGDCDDSNSAVKPGSKVACSVANALC
jgi:hypothetical protein